MIKIFLSFVITLNHIRKDSNFHIENFKLCLNFSKLRYNSKTFKIKLQLRKL